MVIPSFCVEEELSTISGQARVPSLTGRNIYAEYERDKDTGLYYISLKAGEFKNNFKMQLSPRLGTLAVVNENCTYISSTIDANNTKCKVDNKYDFNSTYTTFHQNVDFDIFGKDYVMKEYTGLISEVQPSF